MRGFGQLRRLAQIRRVARKYGLDRMPGVPSLGIGPSLAYRRMKSKPVGVRLRLALQELGPVFVKLGQMLSTRPDILPPDIAQELTLLQDEVAPFPGEQARRIVSETYGCDVNEVFESFTQEPLASASIAQVHAARLQSGRGESPGMEVVVKVLRPGIKKQIDRDLSLLYLIADLIERWWAEARRLHPRAVVSEYEKIIYNELDLLREGANASQLRRNWLGSDLIYHPIVLFDYTSTNVLVMERVYGVNIDEIKALRAAGVNFRVLAERGVEIFFSQVFRDNFFHADMHPGNIFVDTEDPESPRYIALDFGIVGTLSPSDQRYLAENILAFFNRDYRRVAELHVESGWVAPDTRIDEFQSAIRAVSEPIFNRPLKDISLGIFLVRLFQTARRFNMEIQPQLVLLQKTLLNVEGLGRQLYPELDLWQTAKPIMERWVRERVGPRATLGRMRDQVPEMAEIMPELAHQVLRKLRGMDDAGLVADDGRSLNALREEIRRSRRHAVNAVVGAALIVGACLLLLISGGVQIGWLAALEGAMGALGLAVCWRALRED
jgi:ubiquinone biosynthesis protein